MKRFLIIFIAFMVVVGGGYYLYKQGRTIVVENEPSGDIVETPVPISITSEEIRKENYSGSKPIIAGSSQLAVAARAHIASRIEEFETQANTDVPSMREEFGADSPTANYTIEIQAFQVESDTTESIVISEYVYTGGAHGSSSYKVMTASKTNGKILTLADMVTEGKKAELASLVQKKLLDWRPSGSEEPVVFEDSVEELTFDSFQNWALDNKNIIFYFSQYEVGPGVLGAFKLPIPRGEISALLK